MLQISQQGRTIKIGPFNASSLQSRANKKLTVAVIKAFAEIEKHREFIFFHKDYLLFDEFFALDFYIFFMLLKRKIYSEAADLIKENTWVKKLFNSQPLPIDFSAIEKAGINLYPYQKEVIENYSKYVPALDLKGQFLALEQGLGKTLTSIGLMLARHKKTVIIVCPSSLLQQWADVLKQYNQKFCIQQYTPGCKWFLINYERIHKIPPAIITKDTGLIIDEAHFVRKMSAQRTQKLISLVYNHQKEINDIVLLSGTPIISHYKEYLPYLILLDPHADMTLWTQWLNLYMTDEVALHILAKYRFTYYFKTLKKEDILDLPGKHIIQFTAKVPHIKRYLWDNIFADIQKDFNKNYHKYFKQYLDERKRIFKKIKDQLGTERYKQLKEKSLKDFIEAVLNECDLTTEERHFLRKVPIKDSNFKLSLYLTLIQNELNKRRNEIIDEIVHYNMPAFCKMINKSTKTIVYSSVIPALIKGVDKISNKCHVKSVTISGQDSPSDRATKIKQFQTDDKIKVLGMSNVGAVGLNLIEANTLIVLNSPWREAELAQIEDRIHRIGQEEEVYIYLVNVESTELNIHSHMKQIAEKIKKFTDKIKEPLNGNRNDQEDTDEFNY